MSLRKSPLLTPKLRVAIRQNAQHSTGPRHAAGKEKSRLNALKHGGYAAPENYHATMLALGEDPEQFEALRQDLMTTYGPGDALWEKQTEDLAKLYWRRNRLERMQTGLMLCALEEVEERQHRRALEMAAAAFEPSSLEMLEVAVVPAADPGVRARQTLSYLALIRKCLAEAGGAASEPAVAGGVDPGSNRLRTVLEDLYRDRMGWRVARILRLFRLFCAEGAPGAQDLALPQQRDEAERQELLRLLDEEIAAVEKEWEYAEKVNERKAAIERDACLAPAGETWSMMLRHEAALDRSIDRKVKIVLRQRKDFTRLLELVETPPADDADDPDEQEIDEILGIDIPSEDPTPEEPKEILKTRERTGNVHENKAPLAKSS